MCLFRSVGSRDLHHFPPLIVNSSRSPRRASGGERTDAAGALTRCGFVSFMLSAQNCYSALTLITWDLWSQEYTQYMMFLLNSSIKIRNCESCLWWDFGPWDGFCIILYRNKEKEIKTKTKKGFCLRRLRLVRWMVLEVWRKQLKAPKYSNRAVFIHNRNNKWGR